MDFLPTEFLEKMSNLLGAEYEEFLSSYKQPRYQGLRVNTLKISIDEFRRLAPFELTPIPWVEGGFYYGEADRPGRHPYHAAGLYYIQEPSAMAVAEVLAPLPGEKVLDLCAAPGGKSTQLASRMQGKGLLVANEIHPTRARILAENLERWGATNTLITNENPNKLATRFQKYFDRILVDAPCSGEGMFRKDPDACKEWSAESVANCAERQLDILESASLMLKSGGYLVYSTCTFSPEENEGVISVFLDRHSEFKIIDIPNQPGFSPARPQWAAAHEQIAGCVRLWPHKTNGEGHFVALMRKEGVDPQQSDEVLSKDKKHNPDPRLKDYYNFAANNLNRVPEGEFLFFGDNLYIQPKGIPDLQGLKVVRPGLHLGIFKKNRFEPSQAMAMALSSEDIKNIINLVPEAKEVNEYLHGETIGEKTPKGWLAVCVGSYPLGWGKSDGQIIKNHYPKGLRAKY